MKNKEAIAETLNDLVQINNDRIVGYEKAMHELKDEDGDLKTLFVEMIHESHTLKMALSTELNVLGSETESGTTASGKIYRVWMGVKAVFSGHNRVAILENCEYGEDAAQAAYTSALEGEALPHHIQLILQEQKAVLKAAHDKIKYLRDHKN
jgi:uncharacterized protein (TIGR02284 family)